MGAYEAAGTEQPRACTLARPERFTEILVPIRARSASGLDQVREHSSAGSLGLSKRFEGGATDLYGTATLIDRTPRCQIPKPSAEAGTAASFKADHEGKAVTGRAPYAQILDGTTDAVELHANATCAPSGKNSNR